jgi:hypothetical protein
MKLKTLVWIQIIIGILLLLKVITVVFSAEGASGMGYALGSTLDLLIIAIFALVTGIYNIKQKK